MKEKFLGLGGGGSIELSNLMSPKNNLAINTDAVDLRTINSDNLLFDNGKGLNNYTDLSNEKKGQKKLSIFPDINPLKIMPNANTDSRLVE